MTELMNCLFKLW